MVRMEHSSGLMMDEFRGLAKRVNDNLEAMKSEFNEIKQKADEEKVLNQRNVRGKKRKSPTIFIQGQNEWLVFY